MIPAVTETEAPRAVPEIGRHNRVHMLDMLRGFAIIFVMFYHLLYDLVFIGGMKIPFFFSDGMEIIHRIFLAILFSVSGVCAGFSKNVLKRGTVLFLMGECLTLITAAFMPDNLIVFGVLSCFGMIMLIYGVTEPWLKKLPQVAVFVVSALLAAVFYDFAGTEALLFGSIKLNIPDNLNYLYPIGITSADFYSSDYFPLVPYIFIFLSGTSLSEYAKDGKLPKACYKAKLPVINFCGRHSLWLYVIHQPIFMLLTYIIFVR